MASTSPELDSEPEEVDNMEPDTVIEEPDNSMEYAVVGGFKSKSNKVEELPAVTLTDYKEGTERLVSLKEKLNELQEYRVKYWRKQGINTATLVPTVALTGGIGFVITPLAAAYMARRISSLMVAMRAVIAQINKLRTVFFDSLNTEDWNKAEQKVTINKKIFDAKVSNLKREELKGCL